MKEECGLPISIDDLTLRRVEYEDRSDLFEIYSNPVIACYDFFEPWTIEQVDGLLYEQAQVSPGDPGVPLVLVVDLRSENKVIGACQIVINSFEDQQGEIGFAFNPEFSGHGYATKSVNAAIGFGFKYLELHRIMAAVDARNQRSWRLMERVGMRREAHFIHDNLVDGEWIDDFVYAMLENEWQANICNSD